MLDCNQFAWYDSERREWERNMAKIGNIPTHVDCWRCKGEGSVRKPMSDAGDVLAGFTLGIWAVFRYVALHPREQCPECKGRRILPTHAGSGL